jgi:hypothetical protein
MVQADGTGNGEFIPYARELSHLYYLPLFLRNPDFIYDNKHKIENIALFIVYKEIS